MSHSRKDVRRVATDGRQVTKEGWLLKEGGAARSKWQNRWFRLQGKTINYYTKKEDTTPQGVIYLDEVKDVSKTGEHSGRPHCLVMVTTKDKGKKVYYLSADTEEVLDEWYAAFHANLAPDMPARLLKYATVDVFLSQGVRIAGDVNYNILSYISHRVPHEKKKRDHFGWFCDRSMAVGAVLNLFAEYGWSAEHIYRSSAVSGTDANTALPVIRIIFSKSPHGSGGGSGSGSVIDKSSSKQRSGGGSVISSSSSAQSSPSLSGKFESSGRFLGALIGAAAGKISGLGKGSEEGSSPLPAGGPTITPDASLLEGCDDELIALMKEFDIPLTLLEISPEEND